MLDMYSNNMVSYLAKHPFNRHCVFSSLHRFLSCFLSIKLGIILVMISLLSFYLLWLISKHRHLPHPLPLKLIKVSHLFYFSKSSRTRISFSSLYRIQSSSNCSVACQEDPKAMHRRLLRVFVLA